MSRPDATPPRTDSGRSDASAPTADGTVAAAEHLAALFRSGEPSLVRVEREGEGHFAVVINPKLQPR